MKPGNLVRYAMESHSIYGRCVGLVLGIESDRYSALARAQVRWFGLTNEFYNMMWIPISSLVMNDV